MEKCSAGEEMQRAGEKEILVLHTQEKRKKQLTCMEEERLSKDLIELIKNKPPIYNFQTGKQQWQQTGPALSIT